jgi:hypothetical protein
MQLSGIAEKEGTDISVARLVSFPAGALKKLRSFHSLLVDEDESRYEGLNETHHDEDGTVLVITSLKNESVAAERAAEERRILLHPDVVAAIEAALPDLEAWERTL